MNLSAKTIIDAEKSRRSVRAYTDEVPSDDLISQVIEGGLWAANGRGGQSPIVVAVTNRELRDRLSAMNARIMGTESDPFYGAPVVLVVLAPTDAPTGIYDGSLVMGNLMLTAHALGLASCWIHRAKEEFASDEGKAILTELGITGNWEGIGHCILGYAAQEPAPAKRREGRVVWAK